MKSVAKYLTWWSQSPKTIHSPTPRHPFSFNYRLGNLDPNWATCLKSGQNLSRSGQNTSSKIYSLWQCRHCAAAWARWHKCVRMTVAAWELWHKCGSVRQVIVDKPWENSLHWQVVFWLTRNAYHTLQAVGPKQQLNHRQCKVTSRSKSRQMHLSEAHCVTGLRSWGLSERWLYIETWQRAWAVTVGTVTVWRAAICAWTWKWAKWTTVLASWTLSE